MNMGMVLLVLGQRDALDRLGDCWRLRTRCFTELVQVTFVNNIVTAVGFSCIGENGIEGSACLSGS